MTKLIMREGDIFTSTADAIGHGVNTQGLMGAGIAAKFRDLWPGMYDEYRRTCEEGDFVPGAVMSYDLGEGRVIYNIASQGLPGANAAYDWLAIGVMIAVHDMRIRGLQTLALPRIGSGIGGLDEKRVEMLLGVIARMTPVDIELWTFKAE
ncbi:ADP-ribosyltransferase [Microbacterium phage Pumpernickel]|uniref:ADP-ribosyltransferase n=1 Tax=Microbacterium phage Pumpernickel TaxID=2885983 RepID=A0AAE8Y7Q3_9CAUD|nr:ADP-ribosyltransferase [Microbacterium phage Pumpernickel]UDL15922.1 ADP-ribosyltransferase [Microbacterium phage Pumpernickel]